MSTGVDEFEHGLIIVCKNQEVEHDNEYKTKQTDTFTQFVKGDDNPKFAEDRKSVV